jgi:PKD repeat protein
MIARMHPSRAVSNLPIPLLFVRQRLAAAATLSVALVGCRISSGGAPGEGTVVIRAQALGLTASIDRFEVLASPAERSTWLLADSTGAFVGSLALPAGAQALTATAFAGASAMGAARADLQVIAGQSADVLLRVRGDQLPARSPLITSLVASTTHALAGQTISVSAAADAGGDPVAFSWTDQGCGSFDSPATSSTPWSRSTPGTCRLTVVASSAGGEDSQSIAVTVTAPRPAPAITSLTVSTTSAAVGQAVSLTATADAGGDPVHFSWSDRSCGGSFSSPSAPSTVWVHSTPGVCTLTVTAKSEGGEDARTVSITVGTPGAAPTLSSLVASSERVVAGQIVTLTASASAGMDPVTYAWSDQGCGSFSSTAGAVATWSRSIPGTCLLTVTATSLGRYTSKSVSVIVTGAHPAAAITSLSASPASPIAGQSTTLTAAADAGGDPITYHWSDGGCGAFSSSEGATAIWSRSTPGTCTLTVVATARGGSDSRTSTITVTSAHPAPTLGAASAEPRSPTADQSVAVSASATAGQDRIAYAWTDEGCGTFANPSASSTTWSRPTPGNCILTVTASAPGGSASKSVTVTVVAAHPAPAITSFTVPASAIAGRSIEISASASAGQDPVSYAWSDQGCGSFASASASTTAWSRSTPGTCTLTVTASSVGGSDSRSATVSVHELPPEGTLVRTRVDDFPAPPNGRTAIAPDRCALAFIQRDRTPSAFGDLFSFFRASAQSAGDAWTLMASADGGASWTWFSASNAEPNPAGTSDWNHDSTLAQDSIDYKVHHLYWRSGQTRSEYNRIALRHDGSGHISGWSWEAENVPGPVFSTDGSNGGYAKMTLNEAVDGNGQRVLVLFAVDQPSGTRIARLVATRTAPGASAFSPTGVASWKKLTDVAVAGYDVLGSYNSNTSVDAAAMANFTHQPADTMQQHTTDHCWQQLPADGSLHAFFGPYYYNDQTITGQIRRWRLVRSGANWALDAAINGSEVSSSDGITRPQMGGCYASPNFVWLTYGKPGSGLVVDKVGTSGSWISNALPSPDSTPEAWWYAALSVRGDEATAFLLWERWSLDVHTWRESSGYFDGKEWKVVDESNSWTASGVNGWNGAANWLHGAWPDGLTVFAYPYSDWATNQQRHHSHTISVRP